MVSKIKDHLFSALLVFIAAWVIFGLAAALAVGVVGVVILLPAIVIMSLLQGRRP